MGRVREIPAPDKLKAAISGTWLGHPVHPPSTDLVIGSLLSASVLDLLAPRVGARAAQRLIMVGVAAAMPTAVTGFSDWADIRAPRRRGVLGGSGYLGYVRGVGVNQAAFDVGPEDWTAVPAGVDLTDGQPHSADVEDTPVLLVRHNGRVYAVHEPLHPSRLPAQRGRPRRRHHHVLLPRLPVRYSRRDTPARAATVSQPALEVREADRRIEVRRGTRG